MGFFLSLFTCFLMAVFVLGVYLASNYNKMQDSVQHIKEAHSNIVVFMRKRIELVNRLIDIAKGYGDHEKLTYLSVTQAEHATPTSTSDGEQSLKGVMFHMANMARNYPELKANETYQQLMQDLKEIETELQNKRETFNRYVKSYNVRRTTIPFTFVAASLGFEAAPYFHAEDDASFDRIKDFASEDGADLKKSLANLSDGISRSTQRLGQGSLHLIERGIESGRIELQKLKSAHADTIKTSGSGETQNPEQSSEESSNS
jgi:LemA protein